MVKVFTMQTCPDCVAVKEQIKNDPHFEIIDIGEHIKNLKQFLALRDNNPGFDNAKKNGYVGIPCFVLEDGSITFSLKDVNLKETETGNSCRIDGKGC